VIGTLTIFSRSDFFVAPALGESCLDIPHRYLGIHLNITRSVEFQNRLLPRSERLPSSFDVVPGDFAEAMKVPHTGFEALLVE
jgi:hypothetical protein